MTTAGDLRSKRFAVRLATMIDSGLIWYKHYSRWADQCIAELDDPPLWLLELATVRYVPDAVAVLRRFFWCDPAVEIDSERDDEYVACLILRAEAGAISWATFLREAGDYTDAAGGTCENFYSLLTDLEACEYDADLEVRQRTEIVCEYRGSLSVIRPLHEMFMVHFRATVRAAG